MRLGNAWGLVVTACCACGRIGFAPISAISASSPDATTVDGDPGCPGDVLSGLVGWWRFDELAGTVAADSIGGHDGTLTGGASWTQGHHGGAISFDGVDDSVEIGTSVVYATQAAAFSFSAWIDLTDYFNDTPDVMQIQSDTVSPFNVLLSADPNYLGISAGSGDSSWVAIKTSVQPTTTIWHHVAVVFDGSDPTLVGAYSIYLDAVGQPVAAAGGYGSTTQASRIGAGRDVNNRWHGLVEDVRIYARALSPADVAQAYSACL